MKNLLFVDDEPKVLQGLRRQLWPMRCEWEMNFVESGAQALAFMAAHPVDIIVTDMMMPGMDGSQLLNEVVKSHPRTVRIVLSGHAEREAALRLVGPAHQYLSKPCDADDLRGAISRAFALRDLLANERLKQLALGTSSLPTLPALYSQLTAELEQDSASVERVAEIVSQDPGMTTKIIQLVNSAFFGLPQQITDINEAIAYLGMTTVRSLVLAFQVFSKFDSDKITGFSLEKLASHGRLTGVLARKIAEAERGDLKLRDQCFLAGLLHDIGRLVLAKGLPEEYGRVLQMAQAEGKAVWEVELREFGATHAEVGGYLLGLWGLPHPVVEAVTFHHRPDPDALPGFSAAVAVHVANIFAHDLASTTGLSDRQVNLDQLTRLGLVNRLETWRSRCEIDETCTVTAF